MFLRGDVIEDGSGICRRVIWVNRQMRLLATVNLADETEWPELFDDTEAHELYVTGTWTVTQGETTIFPNEEDIPPEHREQRDKAWAMVGEMFQERLPALFRKKERTRLICEAAAWHSTTKVTIRKHVLRAFQRGMTANALLPDWGRCGAPGAERPSRAGTPKRGRPVAEGHPEGTNVLPEVRKMMLIAADEYERNNKLTFDGAYRHFVRLFFAPTYEELKAKIANDVPLDAFADCGLPTYQQFSYWVRKDRTAIDAQRKRVAPRIFEMGNRQLLSSSNKDTWGPGGRFQIDATILDVYVRSRFDRHVLVGRPTLYVVIDTFSRMIVGIYLGLEHPSWVAAMMAVANASASKVEFCKKYGIDISPEEWPCRHVPGVLLGDNGEMKAAGVDHWLHRLTVMVDNAAAYRADWKGVVERRFGLLQAVFKAFVPGFVECDFKGRGVRDYRLDAVLDIDDVTRIILRQVLYYNNCHELTKYRRHPGLTQDNVPSVPRELWNWGISRLSGEPRKMDERVVRFALMPTETASVHRYGIYFHGNYYTCKYAEVNDWFVKAKEKRFDVKISFDKRNAEEIFVHIKALKAGFEVAVLTRACSDRAGMDHFEVEALMRADALASANRRTGQVIARAMMEDEVKAVVAHAQADFGAGPQVSDREQTRATRQNRAEEMAAERKREALEFSEPLVATAARSQGALAVEATIPHGVPEPRTVEAARHASPSLRQIRARSTGGLNDSLG